MNNQEQLLRTIAQEYNKQTRGFYESASPAWKAVYNAVAPQSYWDLGQFMKHDTGVNDGNELPLLGVENGLLAECSLDNPLVSLLRRPRLTLAEMATVMPNNAQIIERGFVNGDYSDDDNFAATVCAPGAEITSDLSLVKAEFRHGRIAYSTRTGEIDALIETWTNHHDPRRFYFLNRARGISGPRPLSGTLPPNVEQRDVILHSAMMAEMHYLAERFSSKLGRIFWYGDTANNVGTGYKEFPGLDAMIVNDYAGGKAWLTGVAGDLGELNSDVKDFSENLGDADANGYTFYNLLQEIMLEVTTKASQLGVTAEWAIVMTPLTWFKLVQVLPCEMISQGCNTTTTGTTITVNDNSQAAMQEQLRRNQTIDINGRTYPVILDDFIVQTETVDGVTSEATYVSDVYVIPLTVNGQPTLEMHYKSYNVISEALRGMPSEFVNEVAGYSDGGMYHGVVQRDMRCFFIDFKIEPTLVFMWPMLAGRINNVGSLFRQAHTTLNPVA